MPLYDFRCTDCKSEFEKYIKLKDCDCLQSCKKCGGAAVKILSARILRDEPTWLNDEVRGVLQDDSERPIENRTQYNRYLLDNGIAAR